MSKQAIDRNQARAPEAVWQYSANDFFRLSEEPLRLLVDGVKDYAIILLDPQGRVVTWNEGARRLKGYQETEIIGRSMDLFYPADAVAAGKPGSLLARAIVEGRVEDEGWRVRKDGSRFFADVILTPVRDATGSLLGFAKITRNISERRQAEEALRLSEQRFRLLVNAAKDYAIVMLDRSRRVVTWNEGAERLTGYSQAEIIGRPAHTFYPAEAVAAGIPDRLLAEAVAKGRVEDQGWRVRKDGTQFFASVIISAMRDAEGEHVGFAQVTRDFTSHKQVEQALRESEARYRLLADNTNDMIMLVGPDGRRRYVSPACRTLLGYEPDELINLPIGGLVHPDDRAAWFDPSTVDNAVTTAVCRCVRKDGSAIWVESSRHRLPEGGGYVVSIRDISERKAIQDQLTVANQQLRVLATQDGLTGLANRRLFDEMLDLEFRRAARESTTLAVLMMDIDYFKQFNDHYGHLAGDDCLRAVGRTIGAAMRRPADLAARYGGEEFVALLPATAGAGAVAVAHKILDDVHSLRVPHDGSSEKIVTISVGVVTASPRPGAVNPDDTIRDADEKLYCAKRLGRNRVYS